MADQITPEEVTRLGEDFYFTSLQSELEPTHNGEYVAIDVVSGKHFVDKDMLNAVEKARAEFPDRLYYIAMIGNITRTANHKGIKYAWHI